MPPDPILARIPKERLPVVLDKCRRILIDEHGDSAEEADRVVHGLRELIEEAYYLDDPWHYPAPEKYRNTQAVQEVRRIWEDAFNGLEQRRD